MISWSFFLVVLHPAYTSIGISALGSVNTALGLCGGVVFCCLLGCLPCRDYHCCRHDGHGICYVGVKIRLPLCSSAHTSQSRFTHHFALHWTCRTSWRWTSKLAARLPAYSLPSHVEKLGFFLSFTSLFFLSFSTLPFSSFFFLPSSSSLASSIGSGNCELCTGPKELGSEQIAEFTHPPTQTFKVWSPWGNVAQHAGQEGGGTQEYVLLQFSILRFSTCQDSI